MTRKLALSAGAVVVTIGALLAFSAADANGDPPTHDRPVIYVTSQNLFYDSIVNGPLPPKGPFQKLEMGSHGLETDFGPGDPGYLGGRWWVDSNPNGIMDDDDTFFSCPLLGHGSATP